MTTYIRIGAMLLFAAIVASCSGGSSTSETTLTSSPPPSTSKGTISIVLTDASADDYDHAYVTITSVELIGGDGHQLLFSGEETVDLLALRDSVKLFAVSEDVDPDTFSKIRLYAQDMELVVNNSDGSTTTTDVDLVANGKIDLNPRGEFSIAAGEVVFVSLDWDMNESLKLTETGSGRVKMRPVIFVEIGSEPAFKQGLVRVFGEVDAIADDVSAFRLCSPHISMQMPSNPVIGTLCLDIVLNANTGLFNSAGTPMTASDLVVGDPVTVLGLLRRSGDGTVVAPTPTTFQVLALVVEGGPRGTWAQVRGTLETTVDTDAGTFDFLVDNGQGYDNDAVVLGQLFDESRVFSVARDSGVTEITSADLNMGDRAIVDAVKLAATDEASPEGLNISVMLAKTPVDVERDHVKGEILSVDSAAGSLMVSTSGGDICVNTDDETRIFQLFVTDDSVESMPAELGDLTAGSKVGLSGEMMDCFHADLIIAEGQATTP